MSRGEIETSDAGVSSSCCSGVWFSLLSLAWEVTLRTRWGHSMTHCSGTIEERYTRERQPGITAMTTTRSRDKRVRATDRGLLQWRLS
jgi:hypothetical protein